ncbi:MAG: hypothetical protein BMS9Abin29_0426 [Gemmatimonadota bacterium]|nr:MAG: hypothetical protein BMS9Abin29_0426 [Gemmatimonadota bacterium]
MREVKLGTEQIRARAEGFNEMQGKIPVLTRIHVHYTIQIPAGSREKVNRALSTHVERCPTAQSLVGAVDVTWSADIDEEESA